MATLITKNPFTGEETARFSLETYSHAHEKLLSLKNAQISWRQLKLSQRLELVHEGLKYFDQNREKIAVDICEQIGRPLAHARNELNGFFERANYLCSIAESVLKPDKLEDKPGFERSIEHAPLGVVFVISAWNYPLLITVNSVIPALIAGNTVLLKHSSLTPKIGAHFEMAFKNLGPYKNLLIQTVIDHTVTGELIEKSPVDHVVFTGSVSGGRSILRHTSHKFMMPALELGGKDAAYVHSDADIQHAAETIVDGAMYNAGQSCCGMERAYVHESIYDDFIIKAKKLVDAYTIGDPTDESTSLGPLAQEKSVKIILEQINEAKKNGAKIISGGNIKKISAGTFFQATLLTDVKNNMQIMQEENFGPVLPVMKVHNMEEALRHINDSAYGLTAAIFTKNLKLAHEFAAQADVGTVFMNRCDYLDPALPWTGVKHSGCGSSLSKYGFYSVTRNKAIHFRTITKG
ncbi:MAG: hypothetical protein A2Z20_03910 [Bdellovibrionales bacterium RBG_16_40_8]|nr:MAG: hypothetical protein A2Z20_03910 [Bdellovibrionales bacterium RBG_16_40_8]